jgi:hypothetical protein
MKGHPRQLNVHQGLIKNRSLLSRGLAVGPLLVSGRVASWLSASALGPSMSVPVANKKSRSSYHLLFAPATYDIVSYIALLYWYSTGGPNHSIRVTKLGETRLSVYNSGGFNLVPTTHDCYVTMNNTP